MAGAMGGDDPEEKEEKQPLPEFDYSKEAAKYEEDNDEEDEEEEEEDEEQQAEEESEAERRRREKEEEQKRLEAELRPKLEAIEAAIPERKLPVLTPIELKDVFKSMKVKKLRMKALSILMFKVPVRVGQIIWQFIVKNWPIIVKVLAVIGVIALVALGALVIALAIGAIFADNEDPKSQPATSAFGVKGDKFYGVRAVYEDENKAVVELLDQYYMTISESFTEVSKITTIPNSGDAANPYNVTITISTSLLEEGYSFENFEEVAFQTENTEVYNLIKQIADKVYETDKEEGAVIPTNVVDTLKAIKYFGFDETLNADIKTLVADYVKSHYSFVEKDAKSVNKTDVDAVVDSTIEQVFGAEKYLTRTEKLFVKDFLFEKETDNMTDITTLNYKAFIYMPKEQVTFTSFQYSVRFADFNQFNIKLSHKGQDISFTKKEDKSFGESVEAYMYSSSAMLNQSVDAYNYVALPENDISLHALVGNDSYANLLEDNEDATVKLWKFSDEEAMVLKFENESKQSFLCMEWETKYKGKTTKY